MTILAPMRIENFASYLESAVIGYAEDNVTSGRWPRESALARAKAEFERLLPQGLATPSNHIFEIRESKEGATVGSLWFLEHEIFGNRSAFVYDLKVSEQYRRQGHAKRAFFAFESVALKLNISNIALHVFEHNTNARALYHELGYSITGVNMRKSIS